MRRPPLRVTVVVGLLALGTLVGQLLQGDAERTLAAEPVPVVGAAVVCPDVRQADGVGFTRVAVGLAPVADPDPDAGTASVVTRVVGADGGGTLELTAPPQVVPDLGRGVDDGALAVTAEGGSPAGLTAVQTASFGSGPERGLATAPCLPARTDTWLVGGGSTVGESASLVLVNPDPVEAAVDVTVLSAEGPVDPRPGRGLQVPAEGRTVVPLEDLAPARSALAVRVHATRGRVAGALRHSRIEGATAGGFEYAATSAAPSEELTIPALPAGPGGRSVLIANPAETEVVVEVEVTAADGQFVPEGLAELVVPAGSTVSAGLSSALAATPAAVRVTATGGPVLAAGVVESPPGEGGVRDLAYVAAAAPLSGPALVTDVPVDGATSHVLLLSAFGGDAAVDVEVVPVAGGQSVTIPARSVEVPGGSTAALSLADVVPADLRSPVAVVVRPVATAAPVHASYVRSASPPEGPLLTALALRGALPDVERPRVARDPAVGAG